MKRTGKNARKIRRYTGDCCPLVLIPVRLCSTQKPLADSPGGGAQHAAHLSGQVTGVSKACLVGDRGHRRSVAGEQIGGHFHAAPDHVLTHRHTRGFAERRLQVRDTQARGLRNGGERNVLVQVALDVGEDGAKTGTGNAAARRPFGSINRDAPTRSAPYPARRPPKRTGYTRARHRCRLAHPNRGA